MVFKSLLGILRAYRSFAVLSICLISTGNALASFTAVLDLERGTLLEGHAEFINSPSASSQILTNDVNDLPLTGNDLLLDHAFTQVTPSLLELDITIFASPGETLFVNSSELGDRVLFIFEDLELGGAYTFDSATFQVGTSGTFSTVSPAGISVLGNGDTGSLMLLDFYFDDPTDFDGVDTLTMSASFNAVPIPAAVWLFGSGLIGLIGVARRKKA